jgi:ABC-type glycerol-3-phosphate transport system substrate-binding protein
MLRIRELDPTTTVTVAPIPTTEKGGSPTSGCVWWVPKGAKNMDQTWTFLKYLAGEEWQIRYSGPGADPLPPTNKVAVAELAQLPELDWLQLLVSQKVFETALVPPRSTVYGKVSVEYRDRIEDLFYNFDVPVERVLQEIEDRANDYLAQQ